MRGRTQCGLDLLENLEVLQLDLDIFNIISKGKYKDKRQNTKTKDERRAENTKTKDKTVCHNTRYDLHNLRTTRL